MVCLMSVTLFSPSAGSKITQANIHSHTIYTQVQSIQLTTHQMVYMDVMSSLASSFSPMFLRAVCSTDQDGIPT